MRRSQLVAALAATGIVALCLATIGGAVASAGARGQVERPDEARLPVDLVWTWLNTCQITAIGEHASATGYSTMTTDADGLITVQYGTVDERGAFILDEGRSAAVNTCLATRLVEPGSPSYGSVSSGHPSDAQGLALYDWAVRYQQPCLASRGITTTVPPLEQFIDEDSVPWYLLDQYIWSSDRGRVDLDFDALLEARLACPPSPTYLVDAATW